MEVFQDAADSTRILGFLGSARIEVVKNGKVVLTLNGDGSEGFIKVHDSDGTPIRKVKTVPS